MKETIIDLEEAYENKKLRYDNPKRYYRLKEYKERKKKGLCIRCGRKKITESQKKRGLISCYKCRIKRK